MCVQQTHCDVRFLGSRSQARVSQFVPAYTHIAIFSFDMSCRHVNECYDAELEVMLRSQLWLPDCETVLVSCSQRTPTNFAPQTNTTKSSIALFCSFLWRWRPLVEL